MTWWKMTNDNLRSKLKLLGLVEDEEGYWYIPNSILHPEDWIIAGYHEEIRMVEGIAINKNNTVTTVGLTNKHYNVFKDEEFILTRMNKLITQYKQIVYDLKFIEIKKDFV